MPDALRRRCENCRRWTPTPRPGGRAPTGGTCADPTVNADPSAAGVAGFGRVIAKRKLKVIETRRDAVCPQFTPLPVRHRQVNRPRP